MTQLFVNNFSATVAQTFGSSDQYLYLDSAAGLPALTGGNHLLLTVFRKAGVVESGHEVIRVTAITENMLTVERAVEGAAATLFNVGDRVEARVTAGALSAKADVAALTEGLSTKQPVGTYATGTGSAEGVNTGDQDISGKQDVLVSGVTIKTLAGNSLLGSGDLEISGGLTTTNIKTQAYTMLSNDLVLTDSSAAPFTVNLPINPVDGDKVGFLDVTNSCGLNNVLLAVAVGNTVEGDSDGVSVNIGNSYFELLFINGNWKFLDTPTRLEFQEVLVSGLNIKTINGESILGSGDKSIQDPYSLRALQYAKASLA